jgi:hypothetical protein
VAQHQQGFLVVLVQWLLLGQGCREELRLQCLQMQQQQQQQVSQLSQPLEVLVGTLLLLLLVYLLLLRLCPEFLQIVPLQQSQVGTAVRPSVATAIPNTL